MLPCNYIFHMKLFLGSNSAGIAGFLGDNIGDIEAFLVDNKFCSNKEGGTEESYGGCSQECKLSMWWVWFYTSKEGGTEESCGGYSQGWSLSMWQVWFHSNKEAVHRDGAYQCDKCDFAQIPPIFPI